MFHNILFKLSKTPGLADPVEKQRGGEQIGGAPGEALRASICASSSASALLPEPWSLRRHA
ncbi:hypothetical protein UA70_27035, partial [Raoultella planticola]